MATKTDTASTEVTLPLMSDEDAQTITKALSNLFGVVKSRGDALSAFNGDDGDQRHAICVRVLKGMMQRETAHKEAGVAEFRSKVAAICETYMVAARADKSEWSKLTEAFRARLGCKTFSDTVAVPLSAILSVFPKDTTETGAAKIAFDLGYKVSKGKKDLNLLLPFTDAQAPTLVAATIVATEETTATEENTEETATANAAE